MPKNNSIKSILIIGSGPIVIGQACEFDYSGSQAARSLREEGIEVTLINSNPATIMTDKVVADNIYLKPLEPESILEILSKHKIDAVLPTMGGQTALNCGLELQEKGHAVSHAHIRYLRPFPKNLGDIIKNFDTVLIPLNEIEPSETRESILNWLSIILFS